MALRGIETEDLKIDSGRTREGYLRADYERYLRTFPRRTIEDYQFHPIGKRVSAGIPAHRVAVIAAQVCVKVHNQAGWRA